MRARVFPESFLRCMSPEDRKAIGQMTMADSYHKYAQGQERELKREVLNWLNLQGAWKFDQPMNKKTRGRPGVPDIIGCYRGYFIAIELKTKGETLTSEQAKECAAINAAHGNVCVAYCLRDVIKALRAIDKLMQQDATSKLNRLTDTQHLHFID